MFDWNVIAMGILPNPKFPLQNQREVTLLSQLVYGEARNQDHEGMKAVACVAINRWERLSVNSIRDVILAKKQFSCFNPGDANFKKIQFISIDDIPVWTQCVTAALSVYTGMEKDNTEGATHYLTLHCYYHDRPKWNWSQLRETCQIGNHIFFKEI